MAVVTCLMALLIWGNSLVPGSGSGSLSLTVMEAIRGFLHSVGLPYEWVTNFVVRKCAHFTEYMVLGILATHAFDFEGRRTFDVLLPTAVFLLLIPSIDETIQLFGAGTRRHDHRCDDRLLWSGNGRCAPISLTVADVRQKGRLGRIVCPRRPFLFEGLYEAW